MTIRPDPTFHATARGRAIRGARSPRTRRGAHWSAVFFTLKNSALISRGRAMPNIFSGSWPACCLVRESPKLRRRTPIGVSFATV